MRNPWLLLPALCSLGANAFRYDERYVDWNINMNEDATDPMDYFTVYDNHTYTPSPENWRFPFYSFFMDRFVNGDPENDSINGTHWEHDIMGTQLRHGGDMQGLVDTLDYLEGLGIKGIYLAGSALYNFPWMSDSYSPLDHTLLDHHYGTLAQWRAGIDAIHAHGMYVLLDNTMATMSDVIAFEGYLNSSTPFKFTEHKAQWKGADRYADWDYSNEWHEECPYSYPRYWDQGGHLIQDNYTAEMKGCMDSEFNQYGDVGAFGTYPEWEKQLSKFNAVQDRLRDWRPSVLSKMEHFYCMIIQALDIDGYRIDKAMQVTVDSQGNFSHAMRECARDLGKYNFFIPGEIVNGNANGAVYIGRGKEPSMQVENLTEAATTNSTYIRDDKYHGLDAGAFHYTTYRGLMRYLGLDGDLLAANDAPVNFVDAWHVMMQTNDFVNANTGKFDPRHMYGVSNQDVIRWPGLINGTERQILGSFITTLLMPGISMLSWGEEQAFYVLDNTAANYVYGRGSMTSAQAWQIHGCYKVGDENLSTFPVNSSLVGCQDDSVSLDHRDPTHDMYHIYKTMFEMRRRYPVLNDGFDVRQLSNQTFFYTLNGSFGVATETGIWSDVRQEFEGVQDLSGEGGAGNQPVWLVHSNYNDSITYEFDCSDNKSALISPFDQGTTVKNLFYPFDEWTLESSPQTLGFNGSTEKNGCLPNMNMTKYGFKAFVPSDVWLRPSPVLNRFILNDSIVGHDQRILSSSESGTDMTMTLELRFTSEMDCDSVRQSLNISSTTEDGTTAKINTDSSDCLTIDADDLPIFYGAMPSIWRYKTNITNISDGIHVVTISNATDSTKTAFTGAKDKVMFRIGQDSNPMVFPKTANYSSTLLYKLESSKRATETEDGFYVSHKAPGADKWRYSLTWGSQWSDWMSYNGGNTTLDKQVWTGTKKQKFDSDHVKVQYWSKAAGSSDHLQEGDAVGSDGYQRRFPHLFVHGPFNEFGYDSGVLNEMKHVGNNTWEYDYMTEWPGQFQINVWGMNPDGEPDVTYAFGDVDNDTILDRVAPTSLEMSVVNVTNLGPESPFLAWRISLNDGDFRFILIGVGNRWRQLVLFILLAIIPPLTAALGVWAYLKAFYQVKWNQIGLTEAKSILPMAIRKHFQSSEVLAEKDGAISPPSGGSSESVGGSVIVNGMSSSLPGGMMVGAALAEQRRTVLIGTMEYDISDWNIKIKIGGLGVMAQLMGKNLQHQDLIWVVPCVGGIDYPIDTPGEPVDVTILGKTYEVQVQYHKLENITYMLLDAPVFRQQSSKEPYPARMDDLDSAIYYSAWNQCIAEACRRFPVDLYHINDYHGTVAPLYLLPETIPCCLSLHNAEFQGLWPMRNPKETAEICSVFNLTESVVARYVQFGEIFNLLHAGASILRLHQKGFGAVGVSKKYGKRSWARYPIFWGLKSIGALPNPDPSDVAEWDKKLADPNDISIDEVYESSRGGLRRQAQEWADLKVDPNADLFVFVGRWSMQKGVDLIADVFPAILEQYPNTQLLCVGPTIDLYGKFAALKLDQMVKKYPGRVYSKPEFTALPPFIFSGAEFALIPSRDEPFGLVAVEFGRKGALGVGSRVGGLGQMPGWWYTIESQTTKHQMAQFKSAIHGALKSDYATRAMMRARSAKQRFPVAQWKEDLEILQSNSIKIHDKRVARRKAGLATGANTPFGSGWNTPSLPGWMTPRSGWATPTGMSTPRGGSTPWGGNTPTVTRPSSPIRLTAESSPAVSRNNSFSLGTRSGPGHTMHSYNSRPSVSRRNSFDQGPGRQQRLERIGDEDEGTVHMSAEDARYAREQAQYEARQPFPFLSQDPFDTHGDTFNPYFSGVTTPGAASPGGSTPFLPMPSAAKSQVDLGRVLNEKVDKAPQELQPFFTDPTGLYYRTFERKLANLDGKTSESQLCIEQYLEKSEKQWFNRLHNAKMTTKEDGPAANKHNSKSSLAEMNNESMDQFLLPQNYQAPTGLRRVLSTKIGDWPIYAFLIALGQILAANSYQITLLTGQVGQTASELYTVASIYLGASLVWWIMFRRFATIYTLTLPWFFYGMAFFLLGMAPYASSTSGTGWVQNVATGFYSFASASGSFFFAQNFGSTGSVPVKTWGFRACMIQGTQQIYIVALWFWGDKVTASTNAGNPTASIYGTPMTAIGVPIAVFMWAIGIVLFLGLPIFYRQAPGGVPSFYTAVFRRKIIVWFFVAIFLQNYFLSAPYGRNWKYLWSSKHAPGWAILLLVIFFFVIVWGLILWYFSHLSVTHSWFIPIFAIGLGAPRWCQMLWSTSNIGFYLPWAGGPIASAMLGRSLWLWLGVLDSLQGIGFGMILLQTLTRFHITFTLVAAQMIGSVATMLARATAPDATGPGTVFPDFSVDWRGALAQYDFWICLVFQLIVCAGFFTFFRKEQLSKP